MHFLPDVWVECDACRGTRYNPETLAVTFHGKIDRRRARHVASARRSSCSPTSRRSAASCRRCATSASATSPLGQPAPTLSGGEAQRVKLAAELARPDTGRTLYLLDEPTTGLHFDDIRKLLDVLHRLVDLGNTVVVIEHNLDVIKTADWVIDLGPEAGRGGGEVVADGTPEAGRRGHARASPARSSRASSPPARTPSGRGSTPRPPPGRSLAEVKTAAPERARPTRSSPPGRSTAGAGTPATASPATASPARWDGRDPRAHRRPHPRARRASPRPTGRSAPSSGSPGPSRAPRPSSRRSTGHEWVVTLRFLVPRNTFKRRGPAGPAAA